MSPLTKLKAPTAAFAPTVTPGHDHTVASHLAVVLKVLLYRFSRTMSNKLTTYPIYTLFAVFRLPQNTTAKLFRNPNIFPFYDRFKSILKLMKRQQP